MRKTWDQDEIIEEIKKNINSAFGIDLAQKPDDTPVGELGLDSMGLLDVIMMIEDTIGGSIKNIELPKNPSLRDVANMVMKNISANHHD